MKIIVTGSSGFVGSNLVKKLVQIGHNIVEVKSRKSNDLTQWQEIKKFKNFEALIHLAAVTFIPDSYQNPRKFFYNNIVSTLNALELCRINKAKMIYASSYIYGQPESLPVTENHKKKAHSPYTSSKIIGEELCENYHQAFGIKVIILRPFNIYGPGQKDSFLIPSIINQAKTGKISLKDPTPKRDYIYIEDAVDAYVKAINFNKSPFEIFNIGCGKSYSVNEIVETVCRKLGGNIKIEYSMETRKNEVSDTKADISKAVKMLKWKPRIDLNTGIAKMLLRS